MSNIINTLADFFWSWPLVLLLVLGGIYFTIRTKGVQFRMVGESIRIVREKPDTKGGTSSFGALMVSTASRVGTGNIVGVSTAICVGGPGAVVWMWVTALLGGATGFVESTLAQVYKKKDPDGGASYGGPAYYIEAALHSRPLAILFSISLIVCYGVAFNMLASYNLQSTFSVYSFYNEKSPMIIGVLLGIVCLYCLLGGGKRIVKITSVLVPIMGVFYVLIAFVCALMNIGNLPRMFAMIFSNAFDFQAIFGGFMGSCLMLGFKRGLFSNEAGIGSAPNAAAAADTSHPAKQGLVQMLSVFIDTLLLCTATAFMCLSSNVAPSADIAGAPYVQAAFTSNFGVAGNYFVTIAMFLFAFTTLLGNFYFIENCFTYILGKKPSKLFLSVVRTVGAVIIFCGAIISYAWALADVLQAIMCFINIPVCLVIGKTAYKCLDDYVAQRKAGKNPVFKASSIGLKEKTDYWN